MVNTNKSETFLGSYNKSTTIIFALLLLFAIAALSNARYLPTRSDESRQEKIKEALRQIYMELSNPASDDIGFKSSQSRTGQSPSSAYLDYIGSLPGAMVKRSVQSNNH